MWWLLLLLLFKGVKSGEIRGISIKTKKPRIFSSDVRGSRRKTKISYSSDAKNHKE
jgi:hypothetical protein